MRIASRWSSLVVLALAAMTGCTSLADEPEMTAHFIDVGQANATLLEFPCGTVLIDAGAEDDKYADRLIDYLDAHLKEKDGKKTIDVVFITHTHKDHNSALKRVLENFEVKRYVDNGDVSGSGKPGAAAVRKAIKEGSIDTKLTEVREDQVEGVRSKRGYTSRQIDPFKCSNCDPKIRILSASRDTEPEGWSSEDFDNENNHSLVIRVDFGESSFLFPGDLEEAGIESLIEDYKQHPSELDVDVWEVNHHGADNGTTPELLAKLSPTIAIVSCGNKAYGEASKNLWDAFGYGHPRAKVVELLESAGGVKNARSPEVDVEVADKAKKFHMMHVGKAIYATGWDGTIIVKGFLHKDPEVVQTLHEPAP